MSRKVRGPQLLQILIRKAYGNLTISVFFYVSFAADQEPGNVCTLGGPRELAGGSVGSLFDRRTARLGSARTALPTRPAATVRATAVPHPV